MWFAGFLSESDVVTVTLCVLLDEMRCGVLRLSKSELAACHRQVLVIALEAFRARSATPVSKPVLHPNLAKPAFLKQFWRAPVLKPELLNVPLLKLLFVHGHVTVCGILSEYILSLQILCPS
jgi:hypothetical protein